MAKKRKTPSKSTQAYKKLARYRKAFDELDVTEDGELSAAELHTAMREKGLKLSLSSTLSMMSDADANGDNSISFEEFTAVMDTAATFKGSKAWTTAVRVREEAHPTRTPLAHNLLTIAPLLPSVRINPTTRSFSTTRCSTTRLLAMRSSRARVRRRRRRRRRSSSW
jgi:hypothetical protein